jgi:hypothetical protein
MIAGVVIMKKLYFLILGFSLLFTACETLDDLEQGVSTISTTVSKGAAVGGTTPQGAIDFRKDEVLCSVSGDKEKKDARYLPAVILTPPSSSTQNQAEVLYPDGKKEWTYVVLQSRKAKESDLSLGAEILYMYHQSDDEDMSQEKYRNNEWLFGTVTSADELFKGVVEVDGRPMLVKWIRIAM